MKKTITNFRSIWQIYLAVMISAVLPAYALGQKPQNGDAKAQTKLIKSILTVQADAWNKGDLESFMQTYWKSDKLTFCGGGKTTRGWQATLDNYRKTYPTPEKMGHLHFDHLEIMLIEQNSALVLGDWHLKMKDDTKLDGNFSLVVKKIDGAWKIIHDHSSRRQPDSDS